MGIKTFGFQSKFLIGVPFDISCIIYMYIYIYTFYMSLYTSILCNVPLPLFQTTGQRSSDRNAERTSPAFGFNRLELRSKQLKSKPIPIGAHHTVSGHEAMDLAKRLNEELASQQQQNQQLRPISPDIRAVSPDCEPRSRSFEQRPTSGVCVKEPGTYFWVGIDGRSSKACRRRLHSRLLLRDWNSPPLFYPATKKCVFLLFITFHN